MGLALAALPAMCSSILTNDTWYSFQWNGPVGTSSYGSSLANYGFGAGLVVGGTSAPLTFTLPVASVVVVTDLYFPGDRFELYDNSVLKLTTSVPTQTGVSCGTDPLTCMYGGYISHGFSSLLAAGSHSLTIKVISEVTGVGSGSGALKVTAIPEPTTVGLIGLGLIGLAFRRRSKRS